MIAFALALLLVPQTATQAATPSAQASDAVSLQADLLKDWEAQKNKLMKLAAAMPEDKFAFKPKPELRTWAEQLTHVAGAIVGTMQRLDASVTPPTRPEKADTKADVLKVLGDAFDFGIAVLKKQTDATLTQGVQGPSYYGPGLSTRARLAYRTMVHSEGEYGVMTVYLRLNGITPPASER
jgi:DinB family